MKVVVEGIETNEQLEIVAADGTVTEVQGYLFGRPVPANQIRQLLIASHGRRRRTTSGGGCRRVRLPEALGCKISAAAINGNSLQRGLGLIRLYPLRLLLKGINVRFFRLWCSVEMA